MKTVCSIIIPAYNAERFLSACLESCVAQKCSFPFEVVCVNDGSSDGTWQIIEAYANRDSRVRGVQQKNSGVVLARKIGIESAQGEYVFFCDADDELMPDCLETLGQYLDEGAFDIVRGNEKIDAEFDGIGMVGHALRHGDDNLWAMVIKRELFDDFEYVPELKWGEDFATDVQLYLKAKRVKTVARKIYNYRMNDESVTQSAPYETFLTAYASIARIRVLLRRSGVMAALRAEWISYNIRVGLPLSYNKRYRYNHWSFSLQSFLWNMLVRHPIAVLRGAFMTSGISRTCVPIVLLFEPIATMVIAMRVKMQN